MRISCCLLLASAAALAQNAPEKTVPAPILPEQNAAPANPLLDSAQWKAAMDEWKQKMARVNLPNLQNPYQLQGAPVFKPAVCAIPLLNVVPPGTRDKMPAVQPPANPRENRDTVRVPAPACENGAFRNLPQPQIEKVKP